MKIKLTDSRGHLFANVATWDKANEAAKAVIKRKNWSDLYYSIQFDNGDQAEGSIDLEPYSFWESRLGLIVTWHLKTFWGNISRLQGPKFGISQEDIEECKRRLELVK